MDNVQLSHLKDVDMVTLNKKYKLCSLHFENSMFQNKLKNRLVSNAIPTLFEVVTEKNVEEEQTVENVMIDDDIELVDVCLPSCSTPSMF